MRDLSPSAWVIPRFLGNRVINGNLAFRFSKSRCGCGVNLSLSLPNLIDYLNNLDFDQFRRNVWIMKFVRKFMLAALVCLLTLLSLTGCSSNGLSSLSKDSFNLEEVQLELSSVFPDCNLEKLTLAKEGEAKGLWATEKVVLEHIVSDMEFLSNPENKLPVIKNSGWNISPDENTYTWKLNSISEIYVCNTNGIPLSELSSWTEKTNKKKQAFWDACTGFYKKSTESNYQPKDVTRAKNCLRELDSFERNGEWVILTVVEGIEPKELIQSFMTAHNLQWDASKDTFSVLGSTPKAFTSSYIVQFATFDNLPLTLDSIKVLNNSWLSLVSGLKASTWDVLDSDKAGFPGDYSDKWVRPDGGLVYENHLGNALILAEVINPKVEIEECTNALKITDNTATNSDCGRIKVEVFQSDLNTGECTFLAYWNDQNGNSRTGIFRYCDAFTPGSIKEDANYTIRVRVDGPESYTSATGTKNRVLSFTVLGE